MTSCPQKNACTIDKRRGETVSLIVDNSQNVVDGMGGEEVSIKITLKTSA